MRWDPENLVRGPLPPAVWPGETGELRKIVIRSSIVVVLILLIGALSCSVVFAGSSNKSSPRQLSAQERLEAEQRLWDLGYWAGPVDGDFDVASRHALIAFQKVEGRQRTGKLTGAELQADRKSTRLNSSHLVISYAVF